MSLPTTSETAFAKRFRLPAEGVAHARLVLNVIASLDWPMPERVSLLARLARTAQADVGPVLAELALARAPVSSFETLIAADGLAEKRVVGLAKALSAVDPASFSKAASAMQKLLDELDTLRAENSALLREVDRLQAREPTPTGEAATARMRVEEVAESVARQVALAGRALETTSQNLRLGDVSIELRGRATMLDEEVALDLGQTDGGSALGLLFTPARDTNPATGTSAVPDVVGYTLALARRKLEHAGFTVSAIGSTPRGGAVTKQSPTAGANVASGSQIRLIMG